MKKRKIPSNMQPWTANINGKEYEYESGITAEVPDEVAALIDFIDESAPKRDPKAAQRAIEDEVEQIVKDNFAGGVGYEETVWTVMLPETSFEVVSGTSQYIISNSFPCTFEVGKKYTVTFDGETNTYTAIAGDEGMAALINTSLDDFAAGNGWLIGVDTGACWFLTMGSSLVGAHTISISVPGTETHRIGSKYMPINYMPIKVLNTNSAGKLFTDFDPAEPGPSSVPLTYEEAYSLLKSGSPVLIFYKTGRYTVTGIRAATGNAETGWKYIYFDIMDSDSTTVKTFSVENPNWGGTS